MKRFMQEEKKLTEQKMSQDFSLTSVLFEKKADAAGGKLGFVLPFGSEQDEPRSTAEVSDI